MGLSYFLNDAEKWSAKSLAQTGKCGGQRDIGSLTGGNKYVSSAFELFIIEGFSCQPNKTRHATGGAPSICRIIRPTMDDHFQGLNLPFIRKNKKRITINEILFSNLFLTKISNSGNTEPPPSICPRRLEVVEEETPLKVEEEQDSTARGIKELCDRFAIL